MPKESDKELTKGQVTFALMTWLKANENRLETKSARVAAELFEEDEGIHVDPQRVRYTANELQLNLFRRGGRKPFNCDDGFARDAVIAKAIRHLYEQLGCDSPFAKDLNEIVSRRTPENGMERTRTDGDLQKAR